MDTVVLHRGTDSSITRSRSNSSSFRRSFLRNLCNFRPPRLKRDHTTAVLSLFRAKVLAQSG